MTTYEFCAQCARLAKNGQNFTQKFGHRYFSSNAGRVSFWLYDTCICSYNFANNKLFINNGGYNTVTTRRSMNEFFSALNLNVRVNSCKFNFQVNGQNVENGRNITITAA